MALTPTSAAFAAALLSASPVNGVDADVDVTNLIDLPSAQTVITADTDGGILLAQNGLFEGILRETIEGVITGDAPDAEEILRDVIRGGNIPQIDLPQGPTEPTAAGIRRVEDGYVSPAEISRVVRDYGTANNNLHYWDVDVAEYGVVCTAAPNSLSPTQQTMEIVQYNGCNEEAQTSPYPGGELRQGQGTLPAPQPDIARGQQDWSTGWQFDNYDTATGADSVFSRFQRKFDDQPGQYPAVAIAVSRSTGQVGCFEVANSSDGLAEEINPYYCEGLEPPR